MALIQLNRTKTGTPPTSLADGELYIDQLNGDLWWADATGRPVRGVIGGFRSGTRMTFAQSTAPVGWTKDTAHHDKALRVVSGNASTGGATVFSQVFTARGVTGDTVLTTDQIPSHTHTLKDPGHTHSVDFKSDDHTAGSGGMAAGGGNTAATTNATTGITIEAAGGGKAHSHPMDLNIAYVDVIIAVKD